MIVGYARCSTAGQSYEGQIEQLRAAGCERIFAEKESGARSDRPELAKAIASLQPGDVFVVCRLDRLARSTLDLLVTIDRIVKAGASFRSLGDAWCDTTSPHGKLMLAVLGGMAEFERALILSRTKAGRERAMADGVRFGPKPRLTPYQIAEAQRRREAGESPTAIGRVFNVSRQTITRATTETINA